MADLKDMTDWARLQSLLSSQSSGGKNLKIDEATFLAHLQSKVKGQDAILKRRCPSYSPAGSQATERSACL
jgi:hypothetical protein